MAFSKGADSVSLGDILDKVSEVDILSYYLGITEIPCIINSPLRQDNKPSFGLYTRDGKRIFFVDFSTRERGNSFTLLRRIWNCSYEEVLIRINKDISKFNKKASVNRSNSSNIVKVTSTHDSSSSTDLQCKVREWRDYDVEYWASYGVTLKWLKYAEVYPISHKIVIKDNQRYVFLADKYAYAYVEHKEGKVTLKIYQPFNKNGYKWSNKHDNSVVSLWTKVPEYGERICICSSLKDALCLWANTGIPSLAIQGEGYGMSTTAINELKRRYKHIFIKLKSKQKQTFSFKGNNSQPNEKELSDNIDEYNSDNENMNNEYEDINTPQSKVRFGISEKISPIKNQKSPLESSGNKDIGRQIAGSEIERLKRIKRSIQKSSKLNKIKDKAALQNFEKDFKNAKLTSIQQKLKKLSRSSSMKNIDETKYQEKILNYNKEDDFYQEKGIYKKDILGDMLTKIPHHGKYLQTKTSFGMFNQFSKEKRKKGLNCSASYNILNNSSLCEKVQSNYNARYGSVMPANPYGSVLKAREFFFFND